MRSLAITLATAAALTAAEEPKLLDWMNNIAQAQLAERAKAITAIKTVEQAQKRQQWVKQRILALIGGLPDYNGALNAKTTGTLDGGTYTIDKVAFESLPSYWVTANLYLPKSAGKHPAILFALGHWNEGKPAAQRIAANLANKGFVVLAFDPMGQGERQQAWDRRSGTALAGSSTDQHFAAGTQSILMGDSFMRYRVWDAKRALDYLVSRPEVEASKIGATGCSGGGTVTTYISALDPRVKVSAPACYIQSYQLLFKGSIGDSEQSVPGFLASGLDLTDYVQAFAPKPWLISSTEEDFFIPASAKIVYEESQKWYGLWDAKESVNWVVGPGGHGTPLKVRQAIYGWMTKHLMAREDSPEDASLTMFPNLDLQVTTTGQVAEDWNSRDLSEYLKEQLAARIRPGTIAELKSEIRRLATPSTAAPKVRQIGVKQNKGLEETRIAIETELGLEIEAVRISVPGKSGGPAVLLVDSYGITTDRMRTFAEQGATVLSLAPRGMPLSRAERSNALGDWITNTRAWLIGRNLPGMRVHDILRGVDAMGSAKVRVVADGVAGIYALMAAAIDPRIEAVWVDRTPASYRQAFDNPVHRQLHDAVIPGFALHWDLSDVVKALDGRKLIWSDPVNWNNEFVKLNGPVYQYRYFDQMDNGFIEQMLK